jgi:hypothetical protein
MTLKRHPIGCQLAPQRRGARHGPRRMLAMMESYGTITPAMRRAGLDLRAVMMTGSRPVLLLLGLLGFPAGCCVVHVLGRGLPLRQWARHGWQGQPIAQETASGILVAALATIADGYPRLLLDQALAGATGRSLAPRPLAMHRHRLPPAGTGRRPHPNPAALADRTLG